MSKRLFLRNGGSTLVDDDDFERLGHLGWYALRPADGGSTYVVRWNGEKSERLHRVILGLHPGELGDHRSGDTLDNRKANLRRCTQTENNRNKAKSRSKYGQFKGTIWVRADSVWVARIRAGGKQVHLGSFARELDAARAYDAAALKYYGDFARLNLPTERRRRIAELEHAERAVSVAA